MVKISFTTGGEAFEEPELELADVIRRVLRDMLLDLSGPGFGTGSIRDTNGNNIGNWTYNNLKDNENV